MAELSLSCPATTVTSEAGGNVNINNKTLIRTGNALGANTPITFNSPGIGWASSGDALTFSGVNDFINNTQFFRNGQLILPGENSSIDNDIYFVDTSSFAFEFPILPNDIIQIWQFTTASG